VAGKTFEISKRQSVQHAKTKHTLDVAQYIFYDSNIC
jgi:hypothetical protein